MLSPRGGQRGGTVTVELTGTALDQPLGLLFHSDGFRVDRIEPVSATAVRCAISVDASCRIGLHALRIRTAAGLSNLKLFSVGSLAECAEVEPNSTRATAQPLMLPITVNGTILPEDVDLFAFDAAAGQTLAFEVEALRLGDTLFDPVLSLYDAEGRILALADDVPLVRQDAIIVFTIATAGRHAIEVRETAYGGGGDFRYRLHAGAFPRPIAVFPSGGTIDTNTALRWIGDPTIGPQTATQPAVPSAEHVILPQRASTQPAPGDLAPSAVPFRLTEHPTVTESEPNNDDDHATRMPVPGAASGVIAAHGDVDCYVLDGMKGQSFEANVYSRRIGSALDPQLTLRALKGGQLIGNDDAVGPDSQFRFTIPQDGKYIVEVRDMLSRGAEGFTYFLELSTIIPSITLTMQPEGGAVVVPAGGRAAVLLTATRKDMGGALAITAEGLPPHIRMMSDVMPAGVNQVPVVFESSAPAATQPEAPASAPADTRCAVLVDLIARPTDVKVKVEGRLRQPIDLVKFENNPFYQWTAMQLALAHCDASPIRLVVTPPQVPVVQRGSMELPIRVERDPGFAGEATVRLLWNPPGISSSTVTLKPDQTQASLSITASEGATVCKWTLVAVASVPMPGGPLEVAASPFTLDVAPPFVDFAIARTRTDVGKGVDLLVKLTQRSPFDGEARAELLGLPPKVAASQAAFTRETQELKFPLTVDAGTPPGQYAGITIRAIVQREQQPVPHQSVAGLLIIDQPLPPPDPKIEAARAEARQRADAEKARKKADRAAAADARRKAREAQRQSAPQPAATQPG